MILFRNLPLKPNAYSDTFTARITIDELFKKLIKLIHIFPTYSYELATVF